LGKILCMCQGGNSRSVALGFLMKYRYGEDALACSWEKNSAETLKMLFDWADKIIILQAHFIQYVPAEYHEKVGVVDVGADVWCNGLHPDLLNLLISKLEPGSEKPMTCVECGKEMTCDPSGDCWCKRVEPVPVNPGMMAAGCFCKCPECLEKTRAAVKGG
jgi:hypothetical protein